MNYFTDLFSPETYEAFSRSDRNIPGFRMRQLPWAKRVHAGDQLVCYMTKLSRWIGVLEVLDDCFVDESPLFYPEDDPFVVRFKVRTAVWLPLGKTVPIHDRRVWESLSFTGDADPASSTWTGKVRTSLNRFSDEDGRFLAELLSSQQDGGADYPVNSERFRSLVTQRIRRSDKVVAVTVPQDDAERMPQQNEKDQSIRESSQMQALLAMCGEKMGFRFGCRRMIGPLFSRPGNLKTAA